MKILFSFTFLLLSFCINAQVKQTIYKSKVVVEQREIYLNGGLNASFGGQSRTVISFDLPQNTVQWYYAFSTHPGQSGKDNLKLGIQIASLMVDPTKLSKNLLSNVSIPEGSGKADVFLLSKGNNHTAFLEKWDLNGGSFNYITEGSATSTLQGKVQVDDIVQGRINLGLRNPSTMDAIGISIEIVAIVSEEQVLNEWNNENILKLNAHCKSKFICNDNRIAPMCDCYAEKVKSTTKPSHFSGIEDAKNSTSHIMDSCMTELNCSDLYEKDLTERQKIENEREQRKMVKENVDDLLSQINSAIILTDFKTADELNDSLIQFVDENKAYLDGKSTEWLSNIYYKGARINFLLENLDKSKELIFKGLSLNKETWEAKLTLGTYHFLQNNYSAGEKELLSIGKKEKNDNDTKWFDYLETRFDTLEERGLQNDLITKFREENKI